LRKKTRLKKEKEEKELKRKEKAEAHLYTIIKVSSLTLWVIYMFSLFIKKHPCVNYVV
jgi:hypothetical protein